MSASPAPEGIEERVRRMLDMTRGTMAINVIVADAAEQARAKRAISGRRWARLLTIVTAAEDRRRAAR